MSKMKTGGPASFLDQYDRAPDSQKWSLVLKWMSTSSLEFFTELREKRPIFETPNGVLIARYDDIIEVLNQPSQFTVKFYGPKMGTYLMTQDNTSQHDIEKGIMRSFLEKLDLLSVRRFIGQTGAKILDEADGKIDIGYEYCRMVPALVVQKIFGLSGIHPKHLIRWSYWNQYDTFHNQPFHMRADAKKITTTKKWCSFKMGIYLVFLTVIKILRNATGLSGTDIASRVLAAKYPQKDKFTLPRQVLNIGGLLIGAVETTSQAVIQALNELFNRPEMLKKAIELAKSGNDGELDLIVWEALRFEATFKYMFRTCSKDYTLAKGTKRETLIKQGVTVFPLVASGMFDPEVFEDPFVFKSDRPNKYHLHFGYGYHECMGKMIGMQMVPEMVRQILLRPDVKPDGPIYYGTTPLPQNFTITYMNT